MDREQKEKLVAATSVIGVIGVIAGLYYFWLRPSDDLQAPPPRPETPAPAPVESKPAESEVRYPIERPPAEADKPLPTLAESDPTLQDAILGLGEKGALKRFVNLDSVVRRIVVTLDNLPRDKVPQKYILAQPTPGAFMVSGKDDSGLTINPANFKRYEAAVKTLESIDTRKLVSVYKHFYPLLQEEYRNLGHPTRYFNDRVVEAIDDLLAAPELNELKLVQPKVFFEYAEPTLEELSAGQKTMLRIGTQNAARVKAKLKEIRRELTTSAKTQGG